MTEVAIDYGDVRQVAAATRKRVKAWQDAYRGLRKASAVRASLGPHASRARITSANARYATAAEHFDRVDADLREWAATVDPVDVDALKADFCGHDFYYGQCVRCKEIAGAQP